MVNSFINGCDGQDVGKRDLIEIFSLFSKYLFTDKWVVTVVIYVYKIESQG